MPGGTPRSPSRRTQLLLASILLVVGAAAGCVLDDTGDDPAEPTTAGGSGGEDGEASSPDDGGEANASDPPDEEEPANATSNRTGSPPPDDGSDRPAIPTGFQTIGCRESFAASEVPTAQVREEVPEGFEPSPSPFSPDSGVRPTAWFVMVTSHCESIAYDGPDVDETVVDGGQRFWYAVAVDPPDAYEDPEVDVYFYPLRLVVSDPAAVASLSAWNLPAETGSLNLAEHAGGPAGRAWTVTADGADISYRLDAGTGGWTDFHDPTVRLFGAPENGTVTKGVDFTPQGKTSVSSVNVLSFRLEASDSPFPSPSPPVPATGNVKQTPSGEVALEGSLVTFPDASG